METTQRFTNLADAYGDLELRYEQCELTSRKRFEDLQASEAKCEELIRMQGVLWDAYENQKKLTHAACASEREVWAENQDMRDELVRLRREIQFEGGAREAAEVRAKRMAAELKEMTNLRQCYETLACDYTKRSVDFEQRLKSMTIERDEIQGRLHAIDEAYHKLSSKQAEDDIVDASFHPHANFAVDEGAVLSDQGRLAWRCECGNNGWYRIDGLRSLNWTCRQCGMNHQWRG